MLDFTFCSYFYYSYLTYLLVKLKTCQKLHSSALRFLKGVMLRTKSIDSSNQYFIDYRIELFINSAFTNRRWVDQFV